MSSLVLIGTFVAGAILGSFINVVIYRLPLKISLLNPPSSCPFCKQRIKFYDNIPILSWLLLKGRCRYCKQKISFSYPIVEAISGLIWCTVFGINGFNLNSFSSIILLEGLLLLAFIDYKWYYVPDSVLLILLIFRGILVLLDNPNEFFLNVVSATSIGLAFALLAIILNVVLKKEVLGGGDIKLFATIGFFLGAVPTLLVILGAFCIGGLYSTFQIIRKKLTLGTQVPFVPFILGSTYLKITIGDKLITWYLNLIT